MMEMSHSVNKDSHLAMVAAHSGRLEPMPGDPRELQMMAMRGRPPTVRPEPHENSGTLNKPVPYHLLESSKRPHKCQQCIKAFPNTQQLSQHMLVHNGVRKYKCVFCDKAFKQLSHVQQHQRRHTGETPYKCRVEGCERAFAQMSNLQQHMRNHENVKEAPDRKPYQCNVCARRFTTQTSLRNHMAKVHASLVLPPLTPRLTAQDQSETVSPVTMVTSRDKHTEKAGCSKPSTPKSNSPNHLLTSSDIRQILETTEQFRRELQSLPSLGQLYKFSTQVPHGGHFPMFFASASARNSQ